MGEENLVSVQLQCRCGSSRTLCVRVARNVPEPLRCLPGGAPAEGGAGRSDVFCPRCRASCFDSAEALQRAVNAAVGSGGWGKHQRKGAVVLEC